jgi:WD40 repeat protein
MECKVTLTGHTHHVSSLAISTLGWILYSGSWDATIRVWNLATQRCTQVLQDHSEAVTSIALFSDPSGKQFLASGSKDATIKLWDLDSFDCIHTFVGHEDGVTCLDIFDNGRRLLSGRCVVVYD